jgi:prepilin-type processing-associated H-X9-DG protein
LVALLVYLAGGDDRNRDLDASVLRHVAHELRWYVPQHGDVLPKGSRKFVANPNDPAGAGTDLDARPEDRAISWISELLPYHESVTLYTAINFTKPWDDPENAGVARHRIVRNSTDLGQWGYTLPESAEAPAGSPFVGIAGVGVDSGGLPAADPRVGAFGFGRQTAMADIEDGLATTMIVATTEDVSGHWLAGDQGTVRGLDPARLPYIGKSRQFGRGGGAAVLFADGSVRIIGESVAPRIYEAMATIHGKEGVAKGDLGQLKYPPED